LFLPFLANFTHKAVYRRQTKTFCDGTLGCFGFWFHAESMPSLKNENVEKYFWIFWGGFKKNIYISKVKIVFFIHQNA